MAVLAAVAVPTIRAAIMRVVVVEAIAEAEAEVGDLDPSIGVQEAEAEDLTIPEMSRITLPE